MTSTDPRARLLDLAATGATSLAALSAMLGRNPAYLQQWVKRGSPRVLAERDRRMLANFFGVPETVLGAEPSAPVPLRVLRLDVAASAGPGATVEGEVVLLCWKLGETAITHWHATEEDADARRPLDARFGKGERERLN